MTTYTKLNIEDVEDSAPKFGLSPGLEARFGRRPLGSEIVAASRETLAPNFRVPFGHRHLEQEEIYFVLRGSGRIKIDDEILDLREGDLVRLGRGVWRCTEAGPDGLSYLAIGAPVADEDDSEIVQGWWPD